MAIDGLIKGLREERKRLDMEEVKQLSEDTTFGILSHLPKLPPLTVKKEKERQNKDM